MGLSHTPRAVRYHELSISGLKKIRTSIILMLAGLALALATGAIYFKTGETWLIKMLGIIASLVEIAGNVLVYQGFSDLSEYSDYYSIGKTGGLLALVGSIINLISPGSNLASLITFVGVILVLVALWRVGEIEPTDDIRGGIMLSIAGVILIVLVIGIILLIYGIIKIYRGINATIRYIEKARSEATTEQANHMSSQP